MLFYTHLVFSLIISVLFLDGITNKLVFLLFVIIFTAVPDIDSSKSKIGKKLGGISKLINFFLGHRKIFHSLLFIFLTFIILSFISPEISLAFLIGTISHIFLDALNPEGIMPFYPLKFRIKGNIKTGSFTEKLLFLVLLVILIIISTGHTQFLKIF